MNILGISSLLGYLLWWLFDFTKNYGLAVILFTLVINAIMFPFSIKSRKGMASSARFSKKQEDIKKMYPNDKKKQQEEIAKMYEKEGYNPMSGCLPMILPLFVSIGIFGTIMSPLQNMLHISADKVHQAVTSLNTLPGVGTSFNLRYAEIELIKIFPNMKNYLTMFSPEEAGQITEINQGFSFLGIDLLNSPITSGFMSFLWLIPVVHFLVTILSQYINQKTNPMASAQMQQGCSKFMPYFMSLPFIYFTFIAPAALGVYYILSSLIMLGQNLVLNHFYNQGILNAKDEAARIALKEQEEALLSPSYREIEREQQPNEKNRGKKNNK